jgi:MFS family permease
VPLGVLLDRIGPRRAEGSLLAFAAAGAAAFAAGRGLASLAAGRALVGLGVSACLMAALKAFAQWFPPDRQASLTGWIMTSGGLGSLAASAPLEAALRLGGWRPVFVALAAATAAAAAWILIAVPERRGAPGAARAGSPWAGVAEVFRSAHFRRLAPLCLSVTGGFMAVQGLWSTSWLVAVNGKTRAAAAEHLAAMAAAMLATYALVGLGATALERRGVATRHLLAGGVALSLSSLLAILAEASPHTRLLWVAYGAFSCFGTLVYPEVARGFPVALAGRAATALNLVVFIGAFGIQWGMGAAIDALRASGLGEARAHRAVFAGLLAMQALAYAWFLLAPRPGAAATAGPTSASP